MFYLLYCHKNPQKHFGKQNHNIWTNYHEVDSILISFLHKKINGLYGRILIILLSVILRDMKTCRLYVYQGYNTLVITKIKREKERCDISAWPPNYACYVKFKHQDTQGYYLLAMPEADSPWRARRAVWRACPTCCVAGEIWFVAVTFPPKTDPLKMWFFW